MEESSQDIPDTSGINVSIYMAAHQLVNRANIQAGPAAQALKCFLKYRVPGHLQTTVIQKDDVIIFCRFRPGLLVPSGHTPGDHGQITGQPLGGGTSGQKLRHRLDI